MVELGDDEHDDLIVEFGVDTTDSLIRRLEKRILILILMTS